MIISFYAAIIYLSAVNDTRRHRWRCLREQVTTQSAISLALCLYA